LIASFVHVSAAPIGDVPNVYRSDHGGTIGTIGTIGTDGGAAMKYMHGSLLFRQLSIFSAAMGSMLSCQGHW